MEIKTKFNIGDMAYTVDRGVYRKVTVSEFVVSVNVTPDSIDEYYGTDPCLSSGLRASRESLLTREEAMAQFPIDMKKRWEELFNSPCPELPVFTEDGDEF